MSSFLLCLGCRWFSAFAVTPLWHPCSSCLESLLFTSSPTGSDKPGGARTNFSSSSSVSSDAQDSVGVSHRFRSLRINFGGGSSSSFDSSSCSFHCHDFRPLSFPQGSFPRSSRHEKFTKKRIVSASDRARSASKGQSAALKNHHSCTERSEWLTQQIGETDVWQTDTETKKRGPMH